MISVDISSQKKDILNRRNQHLYIGQKFPRRKLSYISVVISILYLLVALDFHIRSDNDRHLLREHRVRKRKLRLVLLPNVLQPVLLTVVSFLSSFCHHISIG